MLVLTFRAAGQRYAVDAARVAEVVPRVRMRALPHAPAHLAGVFEYRGEIVTAVDLGVVLGSTPAPDRLSTRIILVDRRPDPRAADAPPALLGLIAEDVDDLASVDPATLAAPLVLIPSAPYLGGIADLGGDLVQLLHVDRILDASPPPGPSPRLPAGARYNELRGPPVPGVRRADRCRRRGPGSLAGPRSGPGAVRGEAAA